MPSPNAVVDVRVIQVTANVVADRVTGATLVLRCAVALPSAPERAVEFDVPLTLDSMLHAQITLLLAMAKDRVGLTVEEA